MNHYLLRFIESGRDAQRGKQPRDLASQLVGAQLESLPGRLYVSSPDDLTGHIAQLHGVSSFSPCRPCSVDELEAAVAGLDLSAARSFAVQVKRFGEHDFSSLEMARRLAAAVLRQWPALRVDLMHPEVAVGVEIRERRAWVFTQIIDGIDRQGAPPVEDATPYPPRFAADQMLGRLAAWLRMLGFDTTYAWDLADSEVVRRANAEGRIVLTRDRPLSKNQAARVWFVEARAVEEQVREVLLRLGRPIPKRQLFQRCAVCNDALISVDKAAVKNRVPPSAWGHYDRFAECRRCDKIYWAGGHYRRVLEALGNLIAS